MHKKTLRVLCVALICVLIFSICPFQAGAAAVTEPDALKQEVVDLYKACLKGFGLKSFRGYCGALVSWQLYKLGITTKYVGANGNDQFDTYKRLEYTSGGYRVKPYSAADYNLKEALNAITENGTKDAYNILVGFQKTNTTAGRKYGHSVFINAIVDGVVYFCESYSSNLAGKYYKEGSAITCSIDQFYNFYKNWTVFEGVIQFNLKTYDEGCTYYPAYLNVSLLEETQMYSAPCRTRVDDRSELLRPMQAGERICVTGLFLNTEGEYWYRVEDSQVGYIPADATQVLSMRYDDVQISNVVAPMELRQGKTFNIKGKISTTYNAICTLRGQVFRYEADKQVHVMSTTDTMDDESYSLSYSKLSDQLAFRKLQLGAYRYELAVVVGNYYFADGALQTEWKTVKLWCSDFQVVSQKGNTYSVSFDAAGGSASLNAAEVAAGDALGSLPEAKREGYEFAGWYTEDGQLVTEGFVVEEDTVLYAHWNTPEHFTGWRMEDGQWIYLEDGQLKTGFICSDGVYYHINAEGSLDIDWVWIEGQLYYFNGNGAMHIGWLETDEGAYYLTAAGAAVGWTVIDGVRYYFNEMGLLQ